MIQPFFDDADKVSMSSSKPFENGTYGVKYRDGTAGVAVWERDAWITRKKVVAFSGIPLAMSPEELSWAASLAIEGRLSEAGSVARLNGAASAIRRARHHVHCARRAQTEAEQMKAIYSATGWYKVAQALGVKLMEHSRDRPSGELVTYAAHEATPTDAAVYAELWSKLGADRRRDLRELTKEFTTQGVPLQLTEVLARLQS